ncbi:MAG: DUF302 domain-containing protein [Candidatus Marinimicrobia bacterium]|nr:DUF302 domain-containing protein [Candidatus Neomarinimicrobiota bacterium]MBL7009708.1 DUF302 domain-containing protein [Candidatus Neomarinimicrobiota bacterium]MBL7029549.1 DUF302 domain-containing protein [Candidatus Neomarinimicrobiota bacterium]
MNYGYERQLNVSMKEAEEKVRGTLKAQGFGVLTEIDVKSTLKTKIDVDFRPYKILGACNPNIAHQALSEELAIGLLLPCNVVIWDNEDGTVNVSAIDAKKMLSITGRDDLEELSTQVNGLLRAAIDAI